MGVVIVGLVVDKAKFQVLKVCKVMKFLCWVCTQFDSMTLAHLLVPAWTAIGPLYLHSESTISKGEVFLVKVNSSLKRPSKQVRGTNQKCFVCGAVQNKERIWGNVFMCSGVESKRENYLSKVFVERR